ncbi:MAG: phosphatase PAP2 family protein [Lachnospiraceae bacterium]|nr:phosphatase PAP2 family protein [Lachnospiraceae bacterium]
MELEILHAIQKMHTDWLDPIMVFLSALGNGGMIWIALSIVLVVPKRTRACGLTMMGAMALSFLIGNLFLKNVIARPRPFVVDSSVTLLIPKPGEYSFPSGHTLNSVTAATVIFLYFKKAGIAALVLAGLIAFSRMYLFVHYPTDILGGIILGIMDAMLAYKITQMVIKKREERL